MPKPYAVLRSSERREKGAGFSLIDIMKLVGRKQDPAEALPSAEALLLRDGVTGDVLERAG